MKRSLNCLGGVVITISTVATMITGAAALSTRWSVEFGTTQADSVLGVAVSSSGDSYMAGQTGGSFPGSTNAGDFDGFVAKYDKSGTAKWTRQFGTAGFDDADGVAVSSRGDVSVSGTTFGAFPGFAADADGDGFVLKYDKSGSLKWIRQFGTADADGTNAVAVSGSGEVFVTGSTTGTFPGLTSAGGTDAFLLKYDRSGTLRWIRQFGTSGEDTPLAMRVSRSGDVYLAGYTDGSFPGFTNAGISDGFLVKFDKSGVQQWQRQFGTTGEDEIFGMSLSRSGDIYLAGDTSGSFSPATNAGGYDALVVKFTKSGTQQWTSQFGTNGNDFAVAAAVSKSGKVFVAGSTNGSFPGFTSAGGFDAIMAKFDSAGAPLSVRQFGTSAFDRAGGLGVLPSGDVLVGGDTEGVFTGLDNAGAFGDAFAIVFPPN